MKWLSAVLGSLLFAAQSALAATPIAYEYNLYVDTHNGYTGLQGYAISANGTWSALQGSPFVEAESQNLTALLTTGKFLFALGAVNGGSDPGVTETSTIYTYSIESTGSLKLLYTTPIPDSDREYPVSYTHLCRLEGTVAVVGAKIAAVPGAAEQRGELAGPPTEHMKRCV